jgi:phosphotriesterase-related protein
VVQTVLGPVDPQNLGITLMHEHLLLDARASWQEPREASRIELSRRPVTPDLLHLLRQDPFMNLDNCSLSDERVAAEEVQRFQTLGGGTVVDATCRGIGRDPDALRRIAVRSGLHIIMGTGYYLERSHPPEVAGCEVEELREIMVRDLLRGDERSGVRAGYIGEIGISQDFTSQEEKVLRAAARAQHDTGVALSVHLPGWERLGHQVLDVVAQEGGDVTLTVLDHMNPSWRDRDYQVSLAARGAYLEYDMIGMDYYFAGQDAQSPSDEENAHALRGLVDAGLVDKLLLSQDVFLKMMLVRYGGNGYGYISEHFVGRLRRHGVSEEAITNMLVANPARVLAGAG